MSIMCCYRKKLCMIVKVILQEFFILDRNMELMDSNFSLHTKIGFGSPERERI